MKNLFFAFIALMIIGSSAQAQNWATTPQPNHPYRPYPQPGNPYYPVPGYPGSYPYYGHAPYPYPAPQPLPYPMPYGYLTCFAQGLGNGAYFYGVGMNVYAAQQWAMYACNSTGQYCQIIGCRY